MKVDLSKIIKHYGINSQQRKLEEEVFELQEAITTHELKQSVEYEIPLTEIVGSKEHITEEIADVLVILTEFLVYYDVEVSEIEKNMKYKIMRQLKRIQKEKHKK